MKVLQSLQSIPKWLWVLIGLLAIALPEAVDFLTQVNGYSPKWLSLITKFVLWVVGYSPLQNKNT